jgi:DNA-binding transcriptional ArsR family regulator
VGERGDDDSAAGDERRSDSGQEFPRVREVRCAEGGVADVEGSGVLPQVHRGVSPDVLDVRHVPVRSACPLVLRRRRVYGNDPGGAVQLSDMSGLAAGACAEVGDNAAGDGSIEQLWFWLNNCAAHTVHANCNESYRPFGARQARATSPSCARDIAQLLLCIYVFGMPDDSRRRITDLAALKVFTHPLRIELWRALNAVRTATASQLAEHVDEAVSLVSYHLRKMADHGFIEEAAGESSDGRERWWRPSEENTFAFRTSDFAENPEGAAVAAAVVRQLQATRYARYTAYLDEAATWPAEWSNGSFTSEYLPRLTAAELQQAAEEFDALAERWRDHGRKAEAAGDTEGREHVALHLYGFPFRP